MRHVISPEFEQQWLLPARIEDWVGPDHEARFIRGFVEELDLEEAGVNNEVSAEGGPMYDRVMLLSLWLYGYLMKVRSTRGLERACREQMGFIWLCGNRPPDHNTLWRFWKQHRTALRGVFRQSVRIAHEMGLVGLILQAVDGTKIQARAGGKLAWDRTTYEKVLGRLDEQIREMEQEIEKAGNPEGSMGSQLGERQALAQRIRGAMKRLEEESTRHVHPQETEARRMECDGRNRFSYNAQAVVDSKQQIIVAAEVDGAVNDMKKLAPMMEAAEGNQAAAVVTLADGGYASAKQLAEAEAKGGEVVVRLSKRLDNAEDPYHSSQFRYEASTDRVICPQGRALEYQRTRQKNGVTTRVYRGTQACRECPVRDQCTRDRHGRTIDVGPYHEALDRHRHKMRQPEAQALLKMRSAIVEPVFAQIKQNGGFRRWTLGGLENVRTQWAMICIAWNLKKLFACWREAWALLPA